MHSVLLIVEKPNTPEVAEYKAWTKVKEELPGIVNKAADPKKALMLGENTFLVFLPENFSIFVELVSYVQSEQLPYQVLFFEKEPQWICYPPLQ